MEMEGFFVLLGLAALGAFVLGPIGFFLTLGARRRLAEAETRLRELAMELEVARRRPAPPAAATKPAPLAEPPGPALDAPAPEPPAPAPEAPRAASVPKVAAAPTGPEVEGEADATSDASPWDTGAAGGGPDARAPSPRPRRVGFEELIGARWSVLVGGLALALGALLLVKYSIEAGLFGPAARVLAGLALGAALIGAGEVLRRRDRGAAATAVSIPAALTAAGTVAVFGALYAAHALYGFIGPTLAFLLLGATGVAAMLAAALHGPALAGVGLVGALAAPLLVSSARPNPWPLVVYLAVVGATAMGLAWMRSWLWLALAAVIGAGLWQLLLIDQAHHARNFADAALLHGLAQTALAIATFAWPLRRYVPTRPDALANGAPAALALLTLGALAARPAAQFGAAWIVAALALVALLGVAGRMVAAAALLAPAAALAGLAALRLWPAADLREIAPRADIDWLILLTPPTELSLFTGFGVAATLGLTALLTQRLRDPAPAPAFAATIWAATAVAAPLAGLALAYARIGGWQISYPFAAMAGLLAFGFVALAGMFRNEAEARAEARLALGFFSAGSIAALALGFVFALAGGTLTVALALAALGAAFVATRLDIGALRWMVAALGALIGARLAYEPRVVAELGTTPVFNWLLFGYGVPALAFGLAARLMQREPEDAPVRIAQALALLFAAFLVFFEIRHALNGGEIYAPAAKLAEAGLQTFSGLAFGVATVLIGGRNPPLIWRLAPVIAGGVSLAASLFGLALAANPLFSGQTVAGGVAFNELLPGYALPALGAIALAMVARGRREAWFVTVAATLALALVFAYASLETRRVFEGPEMAIGRGARQAEIYAYSVVWLALGLMALAWGVIRRSREARLGSAVFVLAATLKIFLYDFAGLQGALRAFSFIGLGLVLIGIGRVYQKLVFARPAPPPDPAGEAPPPVL